MKAADIRSSPHCSTHAPRFGQPKLPSQEVENLLAIVLMLVILGTVLSYTLLTLRNDAAPTANPGAGLELVLSGAVTSTLSLGADELNTVRCSPSGFRLESTRETPFPLELAFSGVPGEAGGSHYILGSRDTFSLRVNGTAYILVSGTVTFRQGVRTFNASLVNVQSQPVQLSGRLLCP